LNYNKSDIEKCLRYWGKSIAAQNVDTLKSKNSGSSASLGISFGTDGLLFTAGASGSKGKTKGNGSTWTETQIQSGNQDGDTVTLQSGTDTNVIGSQVIGNQVIANVGTSGHGNLNIISLQDTNQYKDKQQSIGGSISVGYGKMGGSFNYSDSKTKSNYASVNEQAGFFAGNGGFQVNVNGDTKLTGAVVASSQQAILSHNNTLTTQTLSVNDIHNQAEASVKSDGFSVDSGILSGSKYSAIKALAENSLTGAEANESKSSITYSAIEMSALQILNNTKQELLTGSSAAETVALLNRDTVNANQPLDKIDVKELENTVQAERLIKQAVYNIAVKFTDEAYRTIFLKEATVNVLLKDKDGNVIKNESGTPLYRTLTPEEKQNLQASADGKVHITNNGINNDIDAAAKYASQHSTANGEQYFIYFPIADNGLSELLIAGYQKFIENQYTGLANATQETIDVMQQYGSLGLHVDGHSRGGLTTGNALEYLTSQGDSTSGSLTNTTLYLFGSAYNALKADNLLAPLQNRDSITDTNLLNSMVVQQQTHQADFVGYLLGGNPATGGTIPEDSSFMKETMRVLGGANTVHSCYMNGGVDCEKLWGGTTPLLTPVRTYPLN
jgi:filamentous hemagglutinin